MDWILPLELQLEWHVVPEFYAHGLVIGRVARASL